jgi:hypothetical protein
MAVSRAPVIASAPRLRSREGLARSWQSAVAGVTALGAVVALAWDSGGYFSASYLGVGAIVCAVLGLLLAARPPHYAFSPHALVGLGSLLGLAVWTGFSTHWSTAPVAGFEDMQRCLVYAGLFGLALLAAGSGRLARQLVWGVLAATTIIVGGGLVSRLLPDLLPTIPPELASYRLSYPLGYWNAYGAMASFGTILALGLAADPGTREIPRATAGGIAVATGTAMYFSFSRGAWLALFVGIVALFLLGAHRGSLLLTLALSGAATVLAIVRLSAYPALTENAAAGSGQTAAGHVFGIELLALMALVVFLQWMVATGRSSPRLMASLRRVGRPVAVGLAAGALLVMVGAYAMRTSAVEGRAAAMSHSAADWISRQWADFLRPTTITGPTNTTRLTTARGTRSDMYRIAIDGFEAHPLRGDGAGAFEVRFMRTRRVDESVRDAHSLYLETLSELGIVGALLLLGLVGSIVAAALRSRARPVGLGRSQTAAVGAALMVWLFHSAVDWDWQVPAFTGMALVLAATLYPYGRVTRRERGRPGEPVSPGRPPVTRSRP